MALQMWNKRKSGNRMDQTNIDHPGRLNADCPKCGETEIILRAVVAESVLAKHQLLILNRSRKRSPNLGIRDRFIAAFCSLWIQRKRLSKMAIAFKPSALLRFHRALVQRKYRMLFSPKLRSKPGPKGPTKELTSAVVEMKRRNPSWGCRKLPLRSTSPSECLLIRMSFAEFSPPTTGRNPVPTVRHG